MDSYRSTPEIQNVTKKEYHFFEKFNPDITTVGWVVGILIILISVIGLSGWGIVSCIKSPIKADGCYIDSYPTDIKNTNNSNVIRYRIVLDRKFRNSNTIEGFATFKEAKDAMDTLPECSIK